MARTVKHADIDLGRLDALGGGHRHHILGRAFGQIDDAFGIAGADRQLVHIGIGRVQQAALFRRRQHRKRIRPGLGGDGGAFQGIKRDVDLRAFADPDLFADIQHRRFVTLAFADHHGAVHIERVERLAHRFDRGGISRFLVPAPDQLRRCNCRRFGHAHQFQHQHALDRIITDGLIGSGEVGIGRRVHAQFSLLLLR